RGVVHRDIKPENILVDRATGRAMVTDFGIARLADAMQSGALTRTGQVLGTVGYMSPEQVTGADVDGRSDLYSLGVVAFETLSGRLPFDGPAPVVIVAHATKPAPSLASVAPHVSPALCAVVDRCLAKNPAERYDSGDALAAAFEEAVGTRSATATTAFARGGEDRVLTEREAERVWQRAAELQAGIGSATPPRPPTAAMTIVPRTMTNGFKLEHVRQAAHEAGISAPYVTLALDELLRARANIAPRTSAASSNALPRATSSSPMDVATRMAAAHAVTNVRTLSPKPSKLAGAPMSLLFEVEVPGQLSPDDFDVVAHTIRTMMGEAGIATALGRTLSWTLGAMPRQRRVHVSVTAAAGRTQIRAEERLEHEAGVIFGAGMGGGGAGLGMCSFAVTMGVLHAAIPAIGVLGSVIAGAYLVARKVFASAASRRATELEGLVKTLAIQVTDLIAHNDTPRGKP
ncbi:MAG: serine/threonine-protein kinase, partial [bacterium]